MRARNIASTIEQTRHIYLVRYSVLYLHYIYASHLKMIWH